MKKVSADAKVVRDFERFAASGYKKSLFTKDLYHELSMCFGFIAHFNRDGFYEARFGRLSDRAETLLVMGVETMSWQLSPLEAALRELVVDKRLLVQASEALAIETETMERTELARLKAKYEVKNV